MESRSDKWQKADPREIQCYLLPQGITELCSFKHDVGAGFWSVYVGTNNGVYFAEDVELKLPRDPEVALPELDNIGLEGETIVELVRVQAILYAKTQAGDLYKIGTWLLSEVR